MPDGSSQETSGTGGRSSTGEAASARPAGRSPGETDIFMVRKLWSPAGAGRRGAARAALIYLHATRERDERIAAGMGKLLKDARLARKTGATAKGSGTQRARGKGHAS